MSDVLNIQGNSGVKSLSYLDLKDAYHNIPLTDKSKEHATYHPVWVKLKALYKASAMSINIYV